MAGPPPPWPFAGVAPPGVVASGAQWFSGFGGDTGTPQNPAGPFAGAGARAGASGASSGGGAVPDGNTPLGSTGTSDAGGSAPGARVAKVRKPYTITKQRERWTDEEHERFLAALKLHGRAWRKIEEHIGTKSAVQIRSHAQKFFSKLQRETQRVKREGAEAGAEGAETNANAVHIPPARPKRKPNHPYPRKAPERRAEKKSSAAAGAVAQDSSGNPPRAFGIPGHGASVFNPALMFAGVANGGAPQIPQIPQTAPNAGAALAAFAAAYGANAFAAAGQQQRRNPQEELLRLAAANAGGFGALFASNPMALAQMASATAAAPQTVTPQMAQAAQAAQAQHFFAALAAMGGALPGAAHAASDAGTAEPAGRNVAAAATEVQRPAARPTGDAAAAADVYAAMLAAAAAPGATAAAAGAPASLARGGSGSAFTAFTDPGPVPGPGSGAGGAAGGAAGGVAAAPSAEQMAALANVMLFFPDGGAAAAAEPETRPAEAPATEAERIVARPTHVSTAATGKDAAGTLDPESRGPSSSGGAASGDDGGSGSDRGGAGSGDRGGSGSGSGEGGSGQSAQTKASNGRGVSNGRGASRGFESSSQREPSPPQPRR